YPPNWKTKPLPYRVSHFCSFNREIKKKPSIKLRKLGIYCLSPNSTRLAPTPSCASWLRHLHRLADMQKHGPSSISGCMIWKTADIGLSIQRHSSYRAKITCMRKIRRKRKRSSTERYVTARQSALSATSR